MNWIHLAQDAERWQTLDNTVMNLWIPKRWEISNLTTKSLASGQQMGRSGFLQNVGNDISHDMASHPERQWSSWSFATSWLMNPNSTFHAPPHKSDNATVFYCPRLVTDKSVRHHHASTKWQDMLYLTHFHHRKSVLLIYDAVRILHKNGKQMCDYDLRVE
jgi:hypothetical protein